MKELKFKCTSCGACCKRAGILGLMPQREDGACIHLSEDNKCKIYDTRPELCNVKKMYERRKESMNITEKEYYKWSNGHCNNMILEDGLGKKYLIDIDKEYKD